MAGKDAQDMKKAIVGLALALLFIGGCVSKGYVSQEIAASEARTASQVAAVTDKTNTNATEIARLQALAVELSKKTDKAINQASGFEDYQIIWTGEINFGFDSWDIDGVAGSILDEAGAKLEAVPGSLLEIAGHTDKTGSPKYNYMLGQRRADAAQRYLAEKFGISLYRMFMISYGKDKPVSLGDERNASTKNRRCTLNIWGRLEAQ